MYVDATNPFSYYDLQMKVIWYFWWDVWFDLISNPVQHAESGRAVYLYNDKDKSIYSFSWHIVYDDVIVWISKLLHQDILEVDDEWNLHPLCECERCWWKWYTKKLWVIRFGNVVAKTYVPTKCTCYFSKRLQLTVDKFYLEKDTSKYTPEQLFVAYVLIFDLGIINTMAWDVWF